MHVTTQTNDYIWEIMGTQGFAAGDDIIIGAGAPTTISNGPLVKGQLHRITLNGTVGGAVQLRSMLSNDNPQFVVLVNDSANSINVFPFKATAAGATDTAENINGAQTAFAVAAGQSAAFFSSLAQTKRKGSGTANALNWSASVFN